MRSRQWHFGSISATLINIRIKLLSVTGMSFLRDAGMVSGVQQRSFRSSRRQAEGMSSSHIKRIGTNLWV